MTIRPTGYSEAARTRTVFLPLFETQPLAKEPFFSWLDRSVQTILQDFVKNEFRGQEGQTQSIWVAKTRTRIVLFGLGEASKWSERKTPLLARRLVRYAKAERMSEFTTPVGQAWREKDLETAARIFAENAILANFEFTRYREEPKDGWPEVRLVRLAVDPLNLKNVEQGIAEGIIRGEETNACRELANTPGGDITPAKLAEAAQGVARRYRIRCTALDERNLTRLGMHGILGVSRGSGEKPRLIILEYRPRNASSNPLVLVGKGVTFDTGGLNIKPDQYMYEMHLDMSGGAAVIHGLAAIARLKLPVHVIGLIPAVENMLSGTSYRPGDILKMFSGKTVEVLNTDAEGRIILADALAYALKYKPGFLVDFATLTGAAHVALGNYCSALFTNREKLQSKLIELGERAGDYVWPLPLWEEYLTDIKGTFGDLANIGKGDRYGGAIHGAKFLEQFVDNTPWAHLDIAPKMTTVEGEHLSKGASGVGVRYIVELAKEYPQLEILMSKSK